MTENSAVFFFVSTVLNFASTVFFFVCTYCVKLRQYCVFLRQYCVKPPPGRGQILCNYSTPPPPACIHVYLDYSGGGGGRGSPSNQPPPPHPQYLLTYSYKETHLTRNNTQQHKRTRNNRQQHTTTVFNSTMIHKITISYFLSLFCDHRNSFEIVKTTDHNREHFSLAPQIAVGKEIGLSYIR